MTNHPHRATPNFAIHAAHHFYRGTFGVRPDGVLCSNYHGYVYAFADRADADALACMLNDPGTGLFALSHGQYAVSDYVVIRTAAAAMDLASVMCELGLQYDFCRDGSRIVVSPYPD